MKDGYKALDADGHVDEYEPNAIKFISEHMPKDLRARGPKWIPVPGDIPTEIGANTRGGQFPLPVSISGGPAMITIDGEIWTYPRRSTGAHDVLGMHDPKVRLVDMDEEGIDAAVCFGGGLFIMGAGNIRDQRLAEAFAVACNEWYAWYCSEDPKRLMAPTVMPLRNTAACIKELHRTTDKLKGFVGACLPSNLDERCMDHELFDPIFRECGEMGIPALIHSSASSVTGGIIKGHLPDYAHQPMVFPMELMANLGVILMGGFLDKYPKTKFAFMEGNAEWVPFWAYRLDRYWELARKNGRAIAKKPPSEYFQEDRLYFACCPDEPQLAEAMKYLGDNWVLYNSDYWHGDAFYPNSISTIVARQDIPESAKRKVLAENAERLFNIHL